MGEEKQDQAEERNSGLDLRLGIGDYYLPKIKEKQIQNEKSAPSLQLSVTLFHNQEDGIKVKGSEEEFEEEEEEEEEENGNNKKIKGLSNYKKIICSRKKLRLSKEQSGLLEYSFNQHSTLNPVQKHSLAERLNLTPRQVEVWFQNRRARTKLKQTEVDCELLKKRCESLSKENLRLKKELQELKSQKHKKSQLCLHFPICSSCDQKTPTF